jgi:hypothetical protein
MKAVYTLSHAAINYNHYSEYYRWLLDNKEQVSNILNLGYWRAMMTPEEIEMRRSSGNRSADWIPNRILSIRGSLIDKQLDYLFGKKKWGEKGMDGRCYNCSVNTKRMGQYLSEINKEMEILRDSAAWHEISPEQFAINLKKAIGSHKDYFTKQEIEKAEIYLPYLGGRKLMGLIKGFCPDCWENTIEQQLGWNDSINKW